MACIKNVIISQTQTTETGVILIPNQTITPTNLSQYRLIIACNVNTPTSDLPLYIQTTLGNVEVLCKYANTLYAGQVNKRVAYPLIYGNQNELYPIGQFVIPTCNCINKRTASENEAQAKESNISSL